MKSTPRICIWKHEKNDVKVNSIKRRLGACWSLICRIRSSTITRGERVNIGHLSSLNKVSKSESYARSQHYVTQRDRADLKKLHYDGARTLNEREIFLCSPTRLRSLVRLPLDEVRDNWLGSKHYADNLQAIADHYGLSDDLFKHEYFIPRLPLQVNYPFADEQVNPVYSGNRLYAKDVKSSFLTSDEGRFVWRSLLGQCTAAGSVGEQEHWEGVLYLAVDQSWWSSARRRCRSAALVCVRGETANLNVYWQWTFVSSEEIFPEIRSKRTNPLFLPPSFSCPWHWVTSIRLSPGQASEETHQLHRTLPGSSYALSLGERTKVSIALFSVSLEKRTFRTFDFFQKLCSDLRPVGLAFFQVSRDASVKDTFHNILGRRVHCSRSSVMDEFLWMKEPRYLPPQEFSVEATPFNTYLEKYRDRKDVNEEVTLPVDDLSLQWLSECSQVSLGSAQWQMDPGLVQIRTDQISQTAGQMEDDAIMRELFSSHLLFAESFCCLYKGRTKEKSIDHITSGSDQRIRNFSCSHVSVLSLNTCSTEAMLLPSMPNWLLFSLHGINVISLWLVFICPWSLRVDVDPNEGRVPSPFGSAWEDLAEVLVPRTSRITWPRLKTEEGEMDCCLDASIVRIEYSFGGFAHASESLVVQTSCSHDRLQWW